MAGDDFKFTYELSVDYGNAEWASVVCHALQVDKELKEDLVRKSLSTNGTVLLVSFAAKSPRMLRTSVSSFYDFLTLVTQTVSQFGK